MKIKPEHYSYLLEHFKLFEPVLTSKFLTVHGVKPEDYYKGQGLTPKRMRWDMLYASKLKIGDGKGMSGLPLYEYMDDTHIDTALRSIMKALGLNWAAT